MPKSPGRLAPAGAFTGRPTGWEFFSNLRADAPIITAKIRGTGDPDSPKARKAVARCKGDIGDDAIYPILGALPDARQGSHRGAVIDALSGILDQKTFPTFTPAMVEGSPRAVAGINWALSSSRAYPPHLLLDVLSKPDVPKSAILDVIVAQKDRFGVRELLNAAYNQQPNEKAALFRVIADIADEASVPSELIGRLQGKDPIAACTSSTSSAASTCREVREALQAHAQGSEQAGALAPLSALGRRWTARSTSAQVVPLLRDSGDRRAEQGHRRRDQGETIPTPSSC